MMYSFIIDIKNFLPVLLSLDLYKIYHYYFEIDYKIIIPNVIQDLSISFSKFEWWNLLRLWWRWDKHTK